MKRKSDLIYIIVFFFIISMPVLSMIAGIEVKNSEKRQLAKPPALFEEGVFNTDFPGEFDTYFSENFGLRPMLISGYSGLNYYLLGHSVNDQVIAGKSGWLFFDKTVPDYTGENIMSDYEIEKLARIIWIQSEWLEQQDVKFVFMPVPNKNTIYPEYMPKRYGENDATNIEKLRLALKNTDIRLIDLVDLYNGTKEEVFYQKKDTHWNGKGAMIAFHEMNKAIGLDDESLKLVLEEEKIRSGDLGNMLIPSFGMTDVQPVVHVEQAYETVGRMRTLEDLTIETVNDEGRFNVLMFRDSFANTLIPVMSNMFQYCRYSRSIPYDYSIMETKEIDVVVMEIVERNLRELLTGVPVMPGLKIVDKKFDSYELSDERILIHTASEQGMTRISGFIENMLCNEIYVSINEDSYTAFPLLQDELREQYEDVNGSGFTLSLKEPLSDDDVIHIYISDEGKNIMFSIHSNQVMQN